MFPEPIVAVDRTQEGWTHSTATNVRATAQPQHFIPLNFANPLPP